MNPSKDISNTIHQLARDLKISSLQNELTSITQLNKPEENYKIEVLEQMITAQKGINKKSEEISEDRKKLNTFFQDMNSQIYKQLWHRIPINYKINKLKEFSKINIKKYITDNLSSDKKQEIENMFETFLIDSLKNGTLEPVKYDRVIMSITSLPPIRFDENKFSFIKNIKKKKK